jgi:hypothetical protein
LIANRKACLSFWADLGEYLIMFKVFVGHELFDVGSEGGSGGVIFI